MFPVQSVFLICGWWRPTTLTAGAGLWSFGSPGGARIASTTSEISLHTGNATTNGEWITSSAGLTINTWSFLAFFYTGNDTGPTDIWKVWSCNNLETPPISRTITQVVAPVGNHTNGSNIFCVGNVGNGGTQAFQGQVASMQLYQGSQATRGSFRLSGTSGVLSSSEEDYIYRTFILPAWKFGSFWPHIGSNLERGPDWGMYMAPLDTSLRMRRFDTAIGASISGAGSSGGVVSKEMPPSTINPAEWNNHPGGFLRR